MGTVEAFWLTFNRQDLADAMWRQLPGGYCLDNGSARLIQGAQYRRETNGYFTGGWNTAMQYATADWVWMLNDDVEGVSWAMLHSLEDIARRIPDCAVITPAFSSPHAIFHAMGNAESRPVPWIDWCCPVVRREAWERVGGFDESVAGYGADIDWCTRAKALGWRFYVSDRFSVHHIGSATAMSEGTAGIQSDVGRMDDMLRRKYGRGWQELTQ